MAVGEKKTKEPSEPDAGWRSASLAMMIPTIMLVGPLVGYFLGRWIGDKGFGEPRLGGGIGLLLGFMAGVREIVKIIQRISKS